MPADRSSAPGSPAAPSPKKGRLTPSAGSPPSVNEPATDWLSAFLLSAASTPPEPGLSPEEAAADRRVRRMLRLLAGDQADRAEGDSPKPPAKWQPPRKPR